MPTFSEKQILSFEELSAFLDMPESTLRLYLHSEGHKGIRLTGAKIGRQWRFTRGDVNAFLRALGSVGMEALDPPMLEAAAA